MIGCVFYLHCSDDFYVMFMTGSHTEKAWLDSSLACLFL